MSSLFDELYHEILLDHSKNPRNNKKPECANCSASGFNPLCGDMLDLYIFVKDGVVEDIGFEGSGCAISKASASVMSQVVKGKTIEEVEALFKEFHTLVTTDTEVDLSDEGLEELAAFAGLRAYPMRVKCATLAWHALQSAIKGKEKVVTTEASA